MDTLARLTLRLIWPCWCGINIALIVGRAGHFGQASKIGSAKLGRGSPKLSKWVPPNQVPNLEILWGG